MTDYCKRRLTVLVQLEKEHESRNKAKKVIPSIYSEHFDLIHRLIVIFRKLNAKLSRRGPR